MSVSTVIQRLRIDKIPTNNEGTTLSSLTPALLAPLHAKPIPHDKHIRHSKYQTVLRLSIKAQSVIVTSNEDARDTVRRTDKSPDVATPSSTFQQHPRDRLCAVVTRNWLCTDCTVRSP